MASLDVLDYLQALDAALAPKMRAPLRRAALRDARRLIETLAFRFAILDERPLPEDLDHLRAIEALKPPTRAAEVLLRRAPMYAKARRRRLSTTWAVLAVVALSVGYLAYAATSEKAETLASLNERQGVDTTYSVNQTLTVEPGVNRLHITADVFVPRSSNGNVEVRLRDPHGVTVLLRSFDGYSGNYLRENVLDPVPGAWTLLLDYNAAHGSAVVEVQGVRPTR